MQSPPPPPPPPPAYGHYPLAADTADTGRLPAVFVVGIVAGAMVVAAGLAIAVAIFGSPIAPPTGPGPDPTSSPDPGPDTGAPRVVEVANIAIEVPAGWRTLRADPDTIVLADPDGRAVWLRSTIVSVPFTLDSFQQVLLERRAEQAPDARICGGPETAPLPGGPAGGRFFMICYTHIPQGGGLAARLADAHYIGLDPAGTTVADMQLTAPEAVINEFAVAVRELPAPRWKLLAQ